MEPLKSRRKFLGRALAVLGGLAAVPTFTATAEAAPWRRYGYGWGGTYGYGRRTYPVYQGGWRSYGSYGRPYYGRYRGYGSYVQPYYYGGYGVPYVPPAGGSFYGPAPRTFGGFGYAPPML